MYAVRHTDDCCENVRTFDSEKDAKAYRDYCNREFATDGGRYYVARIG